MYVVSMDILETLLHIYIRAPKLMKPFADLNYEKVLSVKYASSANFSYNGSRSYYEHVVE